MYLIITALSFILMAYFVCSISSAVIICQILKLPDPRTQGSNNAGATNVLRIGGKKAAAFTLFFDMLKGFLPIFIAKLFIDSPYALGFIAIASLLGHIFPIFYQFKGGKGVATSFGVLLGISIPIALLSCLTWLVMLALFRYSSLASLTAVFATPFYSILLGKEQHAITFIFVAVIIFICHKDNICRLIKGTEKKITFLRSSN